MEVQMGTRDSCLEKSGFHHCSYEKKSDIEQLTTSSHSVGSPTNDGS